MLNLTKSPWGSIGIAAPLLLLFTPCSFFSSQDHVPSCRDVRDDYFRRSTDPTKPHYSPDYRFRADVVERYDPLERSRKLFLVIKDRLQVAEAEIPLTYSSFTSTVFVEWGYGTTLWIYQTDDGRTFRVRLIGDDWVKEESGWSQKHVRCTKGGNCTDLAVTDLPPPRLLGSMGFEVYRANCNTNPSRSR